MATPEKIIRTILDNNIDKKIYKNKNNNYNNNNSNNYKKPCLNGISHDDIYTAIRLIFDNIKMSLYKGQRVELRGFGHFDVVEYAPRKARNPKTGETIDLPEQHRVKFKAGKTLNYRINKVYRDKKWKDKKDK